MLSLDKQKDIDAFKFKHFQAISSFFITIAKFSPLATLINCNLSSRSVVLPFFTKTYLLRNVPMFSLSILRKFFSLTSQIRTETLDMIFKKYAIKKVHRRNR